MGLSPFQLPDTRVYSQTYIGSVVKPGHILQNVMILGLQVRLHISIVMLILSKSSLG